MLALMANEQKTPTTNTSKTAGKMVVPVTNNLEALHQIALKHKKGMGSMVPAEALTLQPGLNFVDVDLWAEAGENPQAQRLMEELIPHSKAPQFNPECAGKPYLIVGQPLPKENPLGAVEVKLACAMVQEICDVKELQRLEKIEGRDTVRSTLRTRIAVITKGGKAGKAA